jgi:hypothetical protein
MKATQLTAVVGNLETDSMRFGNLIFEIGGAIVVVPILDNLLSDNHIFVLCSAQIYDFFYKEHRLRRRGGSRPCA